MTTIARIRNQLSKGVDHILTMAETSTFKMLKRISYKQIGAGRLYAVRTPAALDLLLQEEIRHVHIEEADYPEFPVYLMLTNDIDEPYVFISTAEMNEAVAFIR